MLPEPLQADAARARRPWYWRVLAGSLALGLLGLLAFQYAWLAPRDLLDRAPVARPLLERMAPALDAASTALGWDRPVPHDLSRVRVQARDIREDPARPGVLLVQATLVNEAPYPQPPPRLRLTLYDVNGAVVARRVFQPQEYLSGEAATPASGGAPWQLRLELAAPPTAVVSYQLDLL